MFFVVTLEVLCLQFLIDKHFLNQIKQMLAYFNLNKIYSGITWSFIIILIFFLCLVYVFSFQSHLRYVLVMMTLIRAIKKVRN